MPRKYKPKVVVHRGSLCADISFGNARRRLPLRTNDATLAAMLVKQLADAAPSYEVARTSASNPAVRAILKKRVDFAKSRSATRGLEFGLTTDLMVAAYDAQGGACAVTGILFDVSERAQSEDGWKRPYAPSLDRIDSSMGYTAENVRLVCSAANNAMGSWGEAVFIHLAYALVSKRNGMAGD